jgi:hypothetical protein
VGFKLRPDVVFINPDGTSASILYGGGNIEIFDVGNENIFRNVKFYTTRFFTQLWHKMGTVTKNLPRGKNPAS